VSRLRERWAEVDRRALDLLLAAAMTALTAISVVTFSDREGALAWNLLLALPIPMALLLRRSHPLAAAAIGTGCALMLTAFLTPSFNYGPSTISVIIVVYSVGVHSGGARSWLGLALVAGTILATCIVETPDDILFPTLVFGIAPWVIGRALRGHTLMARELADKEATLRHLHELERQSAIAAERSRVARELHDVLAHNLSVMVIQAAGARRLLAADPGAAVAAANLIETTGREALVELRHVFGAVHHGEGESLEGTPGVEQIRGLVRRARRAGLEVELELVGDDEAPLPAGAEMAAYRLVQEALTNTLKHAGAGARARVVVRSRPDGLRLEIEDDGDGTPSPAAAAAGGGHGLVGMRERFALYGGEVAAGPRPEGGFAVRGRLPAARERVGA
jgi:signal transduction histidine kinase